MVMNSVIYEQVWSGILKQSSLKQKFDIKQADEGHQVITRKRLRSSFSSYIRFDEWHRACSHDYIFVSSCESSFQASVDFLL